MKWLTFCAVLALTLLTFGTALAQGEIKLVSQSYETSFPKEIKFRMKAEAEQEIKKVTFFYKVGSAKSVSYNYPTFTPGRSIDAEYALSTTGQRYIVPGSDIEYHYEIEDASGRKLRTDPSKILYKDTRFTWQTIQGEGVTTYYYGREAIARRVAQTAQATLNKMKTEAGQSLERPVKVWVYGSKAEMDVALPFRSQTTTTDIVTQGQAFSESDLVLILGSDPEVEATTAHELTHLITDQLTSNAFAGIPSWLNEGLSMYAEGELRAANRRALDEAIRRNSLLRLRAMSSPAGRPEEVNLFYGQSYSVVRYLITTHGSNKMTELLATYKQGTNTNEALTKVYGFELDGLETAWRAAVGAQPLPSSGGQTGPVQPENVPTIVPFGSKPPSTSPSAPQPQAQPQTNTTLILAGAAVVVFLASIGGLLLFRRR